MRRLVNNADASNGENGDDAGDADENNVNAHPRPETVTLYDAHNALRTIRLFGLYQNYPELENQTDAIEFILIRHSAKAEKQQNNRLSEMSRYNNYNIHVLCTASI